MDVLVEGVRQAIGLLLGGDREILAVLWLSLQVSTTATLIALLLGTQGVEHEDREQRLITRGHSGRRQQLVRGDVLIEHARDQSSRFGAHLGARRRVRRQTPLPTTSAPRDTPRRP